MTYFKLRSFTPETTERVIVISNIIIAILGAVHWGYCGVIGRFLLMTKDLYSYSYGLSYDQMKALFSTQIAYYSIAGIQQVLVSVGVILVTKSYLGATSRYYWLRIMLTLLLFNFAFNFAIGVYTSMMSTYYFSIFKEYLNMVNTTYLQGVFADYIKALNTFMYYSVAEAVITFVIGIPLIIVTVIALLDHSLKEDGNNTIVPEPATLQQINH